CGLPGVWRDQWTLAAPVVPFIRVMTPATIILSIKLVWHFQVHFLKVSDLLILRVYANTENKHVSHGLPSACRPPDSALQRRPTRNTGGPGRPLPFLPAVHRLLHAAARSRNDGRGRWCIQSAVAVHRHLHRHIGGAARLRQPGVPPLPTYASAVDVRRLRACTRHFCRRFHLG